MKQLFSFLFLLSIFIKADAQEKHFIFIQSETRQPFYVSLNGKVYSSTASGYVIVPKLMDGEYNFEIGFGQNLTTEYIFNYTINKRDGGFLLKDFNEKGWGLFNLQTFVVTMPGETKTQAPQAKKEPKSNPIISFDKKTIVIRPNSISIQSTANKMGIENFSKDSVIKGIKTMEGSIAAKLFLDNDSNAAQSHPPSVTKLSELSSGEKLSQVYVDAHGNSGDTIQVVIPVENISGKASTALQNFAKIDSLEKQPGNSQTANEILVKKENCKDVASEDDYVRLRKKMSREITDAAMMMEATKSYQRKCFSTAQIKSLSTLFLTDEGRYNFFEASMKFVSDPQQYQSLSTEFIDSEFAKRFTRLINK